MARVEMLEIPVSLDQESAERIVKDLRRIKAEAIATQRELEAVLALRAKLSEQ